MDEIEILMQSAVASLLSIAETNVRLRRLEWHLAHPGQRPTSEDMEAQIDAAYAAVSANFLPANPMWAAIEERRLARRREIARQFGSKI